MVFARDAVQRREAPWVALIDASRIVREERVHGGAVVENGGVVNRLGGHGVKLPSLNELTNTAD